MSDDLTSLIQRLCGEYRIPITDGLGAVGGGEEPDNANEFVRRFETPPIQKEAAAALERLRYVLKGVRGAIDTGRNEPLVIWRDQIDIALGAAALSPAPVMDAVKQGDA